MRDKKGMIPDLDNMVYEYVVSNNMLGGSVTVASIATAATDAYKAMVKAGRVDAALDFKASAGWVNGFQAPLQPLVVFEVWRVCFCRC